MLAEHNNQVNAHLKASGDLLNLTASQSELEGLITFEKFIQGLDTELAR